MDADRSYEQIGIIQSERIRVGWGVNYETNFLDKLSASSVKWPEWEVAEFQRDRFLLTPRNIF